MLDFPASPTVGQIFTAGSGSWQYDGVKWIEAAALAVPDAPQDGNTYGRRNAAWNAVDAMIAPVAATANTALATANTALATANDNVGRNLLSNPVFSIFQRGTGSWTTSGAYTADRWQMLVNLDAMTCAIGSVAAGGIGGANEAFRYYLGCNITASPSAGSYSLIQQKIEDVSRTSNKTVIVSFYCGPSNAGRVGVELDQVFGTGGSPSATVVVGPQVVNITTGWLRYSVVFSVPSISGKTFGTNNDHSLQVRFWLSSQANAAIGTQSINWGFWGIQCEIVPAGQTQPSQLDVGGTPADQLRQCQRFYQVGNVQLTGYLSASAAVASMKSMPVAMRVTPTTAVTSTVASTNVTTPTVNAADANDLQPYATVTAAGYFNWRATYSASADY